MALMTAAEARDYIPALTGTAEDTLLDTLIARAQKVAGAWCGFPGAAAGTSPDLESATYTLYTGTGVAQVEITHDGRGLQFPVYPVTSVTTLHDDQDGSWDYAAGDLVAATDYVEHGGEGVLLLKADASHGGFSSGIRNVRAVIVAGWASTNEDAKHAIGLLVKHLWDHRKHQGRTQVTGGTQSLTIKQLAADLPAPVRAVLSEFSLPRRWL